MRWFSSKIKGRIGRAIHEADVSARLEMAASAHAEELLRPVLGSAFDDEVFLAGGAFKPLLKPGYPVRDLDLWVRNRKVRERLCEHLIANGAELVHDFHPYCIKFERGSTEIEITYQNVKDKPISSVLERFDIAACSIAAVFQSGKVTGCTVLPSAAQSIAERRVILNDGYIDQLETRRSPDVLQSIDRVTRFAEAFDLEVPEDLCEELWNVYETIYTLEEREACMDTYFKATVDYKGRCDLDLLRRANSAAGDVELLGS